MRAGFRSSWYTTPVLLSGGGTTDWGDPLPETREDLPPALFAPGASTEETEFSDIPNTKAALRWPNRLITNVSEGDRIEVLDRVWEVDGHPKVWPIGTTVMLVRDR